VREGIAVTVAADLTSADRRRVLERLAELAGLMRQPGGLHAAPEPVPLYHVGRGTNTFSTESRETTKP
jgi:hypothetical protein